VIFWMKRRARHPEALSHAAIIDHQRRAFEKYLTLLQGQISRLDLPIYPLFQEFNGGRNHPFLAHVIDFHISQTRIVESSDGFPLQDRSQTVSHVQIVAIMLVLRPFEMITLKSIFRRLNFADFRVSFTMQDDYIFMAFQIFTNFDIVSVLIPKIDSGHLVGLK